MPFIKTAFIKNQDLSVNHYGAIRTRVTGVGNLLMTLYSYDEITSDPQAPIAMSASNNTPPTVLSNFTEMAAKLDIRTTTIDEIFNISQITVYVKETASSFPQ